MSNVAPVEKLVWNLFCPFYNVTASAEFSYGERKFGSNERRSTIYTRTYSTTRYGNGMDVTSLYMGSNDYLVFKHRGAQGTESAGRVLISYPHIYRFIEEMSTVIDTFNNVGAFSADTLNPDLMVLNDQLADKEAAYTFIHDMVQNGTIVFAPCVIITKDEKSNERPDYLPDAGLPGVRMYLNSWEHYAECDVNSFLAFVEFYKRFDLFSMSQSAMMMAMTEGKGIVTSVQGNPEKPRTPMVAPVRRSNNDVPDIDEEAAPVPVRTAPPRNIPQPVRQATARPVPATPPPEETQDAPASSQAVGNKTGLVSGYVRPNAAMAYILPKKRTR